MSLVETIGKDLVTAMKEKKEAELSTLRLVKTALKNKQIDLMRELTEDEGLAVVKTMIKQTKDAMDTFISGKRDDLAAQAKAELAVLERYLPAQMPDAELVSMVRAALAEAGFTSKADAGKAMGAAMKAVAGRADGARVKAAVEQSLS